MAQSVITRRHIYPSPVVQLQSLQLSVVQDAPVVQSRKAGTKRGLVLARLSICV
jgi:hypothetical protein